MLGFHFSTRIDYPPYYFARQGMWPEVYKKLRLEPGLRNAIDHLPAYLGWTWLDHALNQGRLDVIQTLRADFQLQVFSNKAFLTICHAQRQNWTYILQLLNAGIINSNDEYAFQGGQHGTLLDIAVSQKNKDIIATLRLRYGARTIKENDVAFATWQMFAAARVANWKIVYQLLDEKQTAVDSFDRSDKQGRVLLHFAYEQRDQAVFLKLLNHYGASLDEIRNADPLLYDLMVEFYERHCFEAEPLIYAFSQCSLTAPPAPIARPILPGYSRAQQATKTISVENPGLGRLRDDYPNDNDEIIPFPLKMSK